MFFNIIVLIDVILTCIFLKVFSKYTEKIDEEITDIEAEIADLEVKNTKLENEIKTLSKNI